MKIAKEAMGKAIKMQLESIQMIKDIDDMVKSSDTNKNLRAKIESYIQSESPKMIFRSIKEDHF